MVVRNLSRALCQPDFRLDDLNYLMVLSDSPWLAGQVARTSGQAMDFGIRQRQVRYMSHISGRGS